MHDDKKGFNYDAMRRHHGPEDPHHYPSHGHRHPAYDFPDIYHPVPYGKEFLGNQPIHLQDPHSGHIVHPCPPRDWGRHGCEGHHHHEHWHEAPHVPPVNDYLSEYVGLLEDYFHKDKGLDDCDCGEAIRHLRGELRQLLKALDKEVRQLDSSYDSLKSKLAYYIGKTQACIQTTEEYMRRQEYIDADWAEMKAKYDQLIDEWDEIVTINALPYKADYTYSNVLEYPTVADIVEAYASGMPIISGLDTEQDIENEDRYIINVRGEYTHLKHEYNHPQNGTYIELRTFVELKESNGTAVSGGYVLLEDRVELVDECEDKKVIDHPEKWDRTEGYPKLTKLVDYSQGTTPLAVKTGMIDNKAVTEAKLADNSVTSAKIKDGEVKTNDIADANVTTAKLADGAVTSTKIGNKAVTTGKLDDGAVETDKLANDAVSEDKLSAGVRTKLNKADNNTTYTLSKSGSTITLTGSDGSTTSVTDSDENTTDIADGSITSAKLASKAVTRAKLGDASVGTDQLGASSVTEAKIGNGEVTEAKLSTAVQTKLNRADTNNLFVAEYEYSSGGLIRRFNKQDLITAINNGKFCYAHLDEDDEGDEWFLPLATFDPTSTSKTVVFNAEVANQTDNNIHYIKIMDTTVPANAGSGTTLTTWYKGACESGSGSGTDNNTTYSLSKSNGNIILTGSDGSTSQVTDSRLQEQVYNVNLNSQGYFSHYVRGIKSGSVVVLSTDPNCQVTTSYPHQQYIKIGSVPSGWEPAYTVTAPALVANATSVIRVDTLGDIYLYTYDPDTAQIPLNWYLNFSISYWVN